MLKDIHCWITKIIGKTKMLKMVISDLWIMIYIVKNVIVFPKDVSKVINEMIKEERKKKRWIENILEPQIKNVPKCI